jgi:hypothetical protein
MAPVLQQRGSIRAGSAESCKMATAPSVARGARPISSWAGARGASSSSIGVRRGQAQVYCSLTKRAEDVHSGAARGGGSRGGARVGRRRARCIEPEGPEVPRPEAAPDGRQLVGTAHWALRRRAPPPAQ